MDALCKDALAMTEAAEAEAAVDVFTGSENLPRDEKEWSRVFAKWLNDKACFVPEEKGWRSWDGRHWAKDGDTQAVKRLCKQFVDELIIYAQKCPGLEGDARKRFVDHANKYNKLNEREKLIKDAQCEVTVMHSRFDGKPELLNVLNGVYNLESFTFTPGHNPGDYIGQLAPVEYDQDAQCEEWERFMRDSIGDKETIAFVQTIFGLALTSITRDECFFILQGPTRSGKSTTVETIQTLLGSGNDGYSCASDPSTFAPTRFPDGSKPTPDIARLDGKRFVVTSEPPRGMLFNVALLKNLTGRDQITARNLDENPIQYYPQFKLMMTCNALPQVNDMTIFDRESVWVIPFGNHRARHQRDLTLRDRLTAPKSLSGILNWCLDGLRRYNETGLVPTQRVIDATSEYRTQSDKLSLFLRDTLERAAHDSVTGTSLWEEYQSWCNSSGLNPGGKMTFFQDLRERGMMADTATISGKTFRNVVTGYRYIQ